MSSALNKVNNIINLIDENKEDESKKADDTYKNFILGFGNPLLDISASVDDKFMKKYDIKPANAILADPKKHLPMYEELAKMKNVEYIPGGSTLNTIRVCQWMLQNNGKTGYMGCIKDDKFGKLLKSKTEADGVNCNFMFQDKCATGTCAVCLTDKERSLVANLSAANEFKIDHLKNEKSKLFIKNAKVIYNAGFFITVSPDTMKHLAKECLTRNIPYCINFSAAFICQVPPFLATLLELIPMTSYIFTNEDEIKAFGDSNKMKYNSILDLTKQISLMKSKLKNGLTIICTQGKNDVLIGNNGKINNYKVPLLKKEDIIDLNGAGDAFVGGYLSQLVLGKNENICVQAGNYAARTIIQTSGTKLTGKPNFKPN